MYGVAYYPHDAHEQQPELWAPTLTPAQDNACVAAARPPTHQPTSPPSPFWRRWRGGGLAGTGHSARAANDDGQPSPRTVLDRLLGRGVAGMSMRRVAAGFKRWGHAWHPGTWPAVVSVGCAGSRSQLTDGSAALRPLGGRAENIAHDGHPSRATAARRRQEACRTRLHTTFCPSRRPQ